ncbi:MAG: chorismate synthase [Eubacteriales bacterium]|nr:chorismate synthase [Eubacteriales bacterium]MDD3349496.1 chorismate synthase [Eubacteriales bacterium]
MSNVWGEHLKISIFGESHEEAIGIVIGGLPEGEEINFAEIDIEMKRRAPGHNEFSTLRKEVDNVQVVSGILNSKTTGAPLCGVILNTDMHSADYDELFPRPGHADLTALTKYRGFNDSRGGGHFSGRLTAPLTFAGAIAKQILRRRGIVIGAHIQQIAGIKDEKFEQQEKLDQKLFDALAAEEFPVLNLKLVHPMQEAIKAAKADMDSVGGIIECAACGLLAGLGEPFFSSIESQVASMIFSIPAVKGIEFGSGFALSGMRGSVANDPIILKDGKIRTETNHNGGINGGITNGMPLVFRAAIKPTPSIGKPQKTVDLMTMKEKIVEIKGRHDPCIVQRAVPVVEAGLAICLLDAWCREGCR